MHATGIPKKTTLVDIAKCLNVSVSTVSRAINDASDVSAATRKMVLEAANTLNYTPNETAKSLVTQKSNTVAAIIPDILNPYYSEIIKSIENVLVNNGFTLLLCITNENDAHTDYYLNAMLQKRVSGIILLSTFVRNTALLQKIKESTVVVGVQTVHEELDSVLCGNKEDTYRIVQYLTEIGHKRIGFIGYKLQEDSILLDRLLAYKEALADANIEIDSSLIYNGNPTLDPGYYGAMELLEDQSITAIHCMNEYIAMGAYIAICEKGYSIPGDISLSSFDGLKISRIIRPDLTTVKVAVAEMGEAAAEMLLQRIIFGKKSVVQKIYLESQIHIGESTRKI